ncbi:MAG TPA: alpha/beta hydrolase [bacterium]|nr:alpha/beta hydrolase [bacterium]
MDFFHFNDAPGKPILHVAHANGFPPLTYRRFFKPLSQDFQGLAFPARPLWPGSDWRLLKNWSMMADDLLAALKPLAPVVGWGHSLGAVLTLYAALREPWIFTRIVLVDPTLLPPGTLFKAWWMRLVGMEFREGLVRAALRRRRHWASREEALAGYRDKPLFKNWPADVLEDYLSSMTAPDPQGGWSLVYPPEWEAQIYQTIPTDIWKDVAGLKVPSLVIRGGDSNTFTAQSEAAFRRRSPQTLFETVAGAGHLVPHEKPEETAALTLRFLKA